MNKTYNVLRINKWEEAQSVYQGRIRDCKKSLKTIANEYKRIGWETKLYDYTLIIKKNKKDNNLYIYLIHEPEY
jgi:hypothetical protein